MATSFSWPGSLPQSPTKSGFAESFKASILRTPMDSGPAKMRYRGSLPGSFSAVFVMTSDQINTLKTFVFDTIRCTARFSFLHPITQAALEVRIVPSNDGEMFKYAPIGGTFYSVELILEVLP